jgi:primosomal protein N' (replication factor Y)
MPYAHVALPLPLRRTFAYRVPAALRAEARPGAPVRVPFRGRPARGFVIEVSEKPDAGGPDAAAVLDLAEVLGPPVLTPHLIALALWIAEYYMAPIGEVIAAELPGGLEGFARSRARRGAEEDPVVRLALPDRVTLTDAQRDAVREVERAVEARRFAPLLLHGVTASGKTEVYLRGARSARESGGQTLVLVPEVALGSQVVAEFRRRFGGRVGVLHSYLTIGERRRNWELASRGALDVVVGARSAVFAPLPKLRLIVVDEEHEPAYKQSEQLRYHGRDTAVRRAQMLGIPVLLGSATPSLETLANAARGKYARLLLPRRVDGRPMPSVEAVDLRRERAGTLLSEPLKSALADRLRLRQQALLFLNRRGHSHHSQCPQCGFVPECPHCDITLTLHVSPNVWRCHYCDHRQPASARCPQCGGALLRFGVAGTQRAERELARVFPEARVLRLDTDVARDRARPSEVLRAFARGEADVLIGTQMIAKGLDFPRVTLAAVLDADVALHLPDFRAAERTHQLLVQVSGRAGRGKEGGAVIIQTCTPDHPAIAAAVLQRPRLFLDHELEQRREAGYPPFTRLLAIVSSGGDQARVERAASGHAARARESADGASVTVLGPAPRALARLRSQHRWHVLLKGSRAAALREVALHALGGGGAKGAGREVRVTIDVDPTDVL